MIMREIAMQLIGLMGLCLALKTYMGNQKQKRLENSFRIIDFFLDDLDDKDIDEWKYIFINSSECSGAKEGHFLSRENENIPFEYLFSEGAYDKGALERIVQLIDFISYESLEKNIDINIVYFRIGQLMQTTYAWFGKDKDSVIAKHYPYFDKFMKKNCKKFKNLPTKVYCYIE